MIRYLPCIHYHYEDTVPVGDPPYQTYATEEEALAVSGLRAGGMGVDAEAWEIFINDEATQQ